MRYDFALLFTALTALSGAIWLIDALCFAKARRKAMLAEQAAVDAILDARNERIRALTDTQKIEGMGIERDADCLLVGVARAVDLDKLRVVLGRELPDVVIEDEDGKLRLRPRTAPVRTREPLVVDYARSFFPVILVILLVRSFLGEPYRIPSESMMPTLLIGDFILVNKYAYGLRLPVLDTKIVKVGEPRRGDVIVFHPPIAPDQVWIKRVIGLPGDVIDYHDYQLTVNGKPVKYAPIGAYEGHASGVNETGFQLVRENLPGRSHDVLESGMPPFDHDGTWTVPAGEYFMMGDNRDNSLDSRFWPDHFLPEANIVGKAEWIWMNYDFGAWKMDSSRIGTRIR